jgi:uncharacterized membrane protein YkgB
MWFLGGCMAVILAGAVIAVVTVFFWLTSPDAHAQSPIRAVIDCGTLSGSGTVRFIVGDTAFVVRVQCPQPIGA